MNYGELMVSLQKGQPGHLYLLAGEESYYIDKALQRLLQSLLPAGYTEQDYRIIEDGAPISEIIGAIETAPFFLDKNVIVVKAASLFKEKKQAEQQEVKVKGRKKTLTPEERLLQVLSNIPEFSYVIFEVRSKADKRKKLYKALNEYGRILEADPVKANNVGDWLQGKLQELNKEMDRQAYEYFVSAVSSMQSVNLSFLNKELDKLGMFLGQEQRRITKADLLQVMSDVPEISGFAMINAIGERNVAKALQLFRRQLDNGVFFALLVGLLARQIRLWWLAQSLHNKGIRGRALAGPLGQPAFIAEKTAREANQFGAGVLQQALLDLSDADYALKTGQGDLVELENIIINLCAR